MAKVDIDKLICSLIKRSMMGKLLEECLKEQNLVYKDGKITPLSDIHIFEELPKEEQLKWYKCIEPIIVPELKMPLFGEDEVAPLEKIFAYCPKLKNDAELFAKYFRKVVEADLMDTESRKVEEAITNEPIITKEHDIDMKAMVDKYYNEVLIGECKYPEPLANHYRLCYYQGLKDMYQKLKEIMEE